MSIIASKEAFSHFHEKLRLQVPFDEASLSSEKYDIPYSTHSSQRHESVKVGLYNEYTVELM
jgi:hypothetical protein